MRFSLDRSWFSLAILLVGMGYVVLTPPFDAPDETNHFLKAWSVSQGQFLLYPTEDDRLGDTLPQSLGILCTHFRPNGHAPSEQRSWQDTRTMLGLPLKKEQLTFIDFANTGMYAPFAYLPGASIIHILEWLDAPPLYSLYAVRLLHLFGWLWMLSIIGRMAGERRWLFLYAGLLPGILVFQSSANPDTLVHASTWWIIARSMTVAYKNRSSIWEGLLVILVSIQKLIFVPYGLLVGRTGTWSRSAIWTVLALVGALAWGHQATRTFIPYDQYHPKFRDGQTLNPGVDPAAQQQNILEHPLHFITAMTTGILYSAPATIAHLAGKYGWDKHYLPGWVIGVLLIGFLLVLTSTPTTIRPQERLALLALAGSVLLLFCLTNYLLWDPVGLDRMDNFQGRYFIGILPLVAFAGSVRLIQWPYAYRIFQILLIFGHLYMIYNLIQQLS